jgi:hypothetical protein
MDRANDRLFNLVRQISVGGVIGAVKAAQAFLDLYLICITVRRNDRAVVKSDRLRLGWDRTPAERTAIGLRDY